MRSPYFLPISSGFLQYHCLFCVYVSETESLLVYHHSIYLPPDIPSIPFSPGAHTATTSTLKTTYTYSSYALTHSLTLTLTHLLTSSLRFSLLLLLMASCQRLHTFASRPRKTKFPQPQLLFEHADPARLYRLLDLEFILPYPNPSLCLARSHIQSSSRAQALW